MLSGLLNHRRRPAKRTDGEVITDFLVSLARAVITGRCPEDDAKRPQLKERFRFWGDELAGADSEAAMLQAEQQPASKKRVRGGRKIDSRNRRTNERLRVYDEKVVEGNEHEDALKKAVAELSPSKAHVKNVRRSLERAIKKREKKRGGH